MGPFGSLCTLSGLTPDNVIILLATELEVHTDVNQHDTHPDVTQTGRRSALGRVTESGERKGLGIFQKRSVNRECTKYYQIDQ